MPRDVHLIKEIWRVELENMIKSPDVDIGSWGGQLNPEKSACQNAEKPRSDACLVVGDGFFFLLGY